MSGDSPQLNPTALTVEQAARVLSAAGPQPVSADMLSQDIDAGAPTNANGTINLVHFTAWILKEMGRGE